MLRKQKSRRRGRTRDNLPSPRVRRTQIEKDSHTRKARGTRRGWRPTACAAASYRYEGPRYLQRLLSRRKKERSEWFRLQPDERRPEKRRPNVWRSAFDFKNWLRGHDLNVRPSGYEPDELPDCSTPRRHDSERTGVRQIPLNCTELEIDPGVDCYGAQAILWSRVVTLTHAQLQLRHSISVGRLRALPSLSVRECAGVARAGSKG
jgi:hypothetical protein